ELYPASAASSQGPSTRDPVASPTSPTPPRSKGGLFAGIGIGAIVVAGAGFFLLNKGSGEKPVASALPSATAAAPIVSAAAPPPKVCPPKMARIEGGKFFMGSDEKDADPDERPAHQVTLAPYCIDLYEVTAGEYKACSDVGECKRAPLEVEWKDIRPVEKKAFSPLCNERVATSPDRAEHPINCVDWDM